MRKIIVPLLGIGISKKIMLPTHKKMTKAAIKRLCGLCAKLEQMVDEGENCPKILELVLAMQGHAKHIQGLVLESHMHTCASKNLTTKNVKQKDDFIKELIRVVGLSTR